ncbi:MAG: hypothetical protein ACI9BW_003177 [Gammaproteobacteria bacterium]|jgi:hypothetical protein
MQALALTEALVTPSGENVNVEATLDLAVLAQVARGDCVEVERIADRTLELFDRTLKIVAEHHESANHEPLIGNNPSRFVPEHQDLRQRFLFAETVGSYGALHDLLDGYSPAYQLYKGYNPTSQKNRLTPDQIRALEEYRQQIDDALRHANEYLLTNPGASYTSDELQELNAILLEARTRRESLTAILGMQLIVDIEEGVKQLYAFQDKIRTVQRSIDGVFLVDSEVMFMPTNDLVNIVNNLFKAVGNPFVAEHVDGMLLLAARNLLIQAVSFYSYYGKQQIYSVFKRKQTTFNRSMIAHHIREEIKKLFQACQTENRLVLKRVMNDVEREFEISVDSIRVEAERSAVEVVNLLIPKAAVALPARRKTLRQRISAWLFR